MTKWFIFLIMTYVSCALLGTILDHAFLGGEEQSLIVTIMATSANPLTWAPMVGAFASILLFDFSFWYGWYVIFRWIFFVPITVGIGVGLALALKPSWI